MWRSTKGLPSGFSAKFADKELFFYLCPVRSCRILTHGVMATLQILVLSFQVRVLVGQLRERKFPRRNFRSRRFRGRPSGANRAAVGLRIFSSVRRKDHGCVLRSVVVCGVPLSILCGCDIGDGGSFSCRAGLRVCRYGRGRSVGDRMFRCIAVADLVFRIAVQRLAATGCISGARFCGEFEAHTAGTEAVTG